MIQANELRLNNYLHLDGGIYQVNEIYNRLQCVELKRKNQSNPNLNEYEECDLDYENLEPIEIKEDILFLLGFVDKGFGDWRKNRLYISRESKNHFVTNGFIIEIQFLHQLQNLYFAIHGEELVFSLD